MDCNITTGVIGIVGTLGGVWAGNHFAHSRDRGDRKRVCLAFLEQVRGEVDRVWMSDRFGIEYTRKVPNIKGACSLVMGDLRGTEKKGFRNAVDRLCGYTAAEAQKQPEGKKRILEAIDEVIALLE